MGSIEPWQLRDRILERFLRSPLMAPLLDGVELQRDAITLACDAYGLTVWYWPQPGNGLAVATVDEEDWWVPRISGEDHAEYLATRLAAELRQAWDEGRRG